VLTQFVPVDAVPPTREATDAARLTVAPVAAPTIVTDRDPEDATLEWTGLDAAVKVSKVIAFVSDPTAETDEAVKTKSREYPTAEAPSPCVRERSAEEETQVVAEVRVPPTRTADEIQRPTMLPPPPAVAPAPRTVTETAPVGTTLLRLGEEGLGVSTVEAIVMSPRTRDRGAVTAASAIGTPTATLVLANKAEELFQTDASAGAYRPRRKQAVWAPDEARPFPSTVTLTAPEAGWLVAPMELGAGELMDTALVKVDRAK